ncbi:MAG TPA: alginate export family protein [Planctomycetota bacterium]|nr:alginate export family protein [Planctomycetota bacterium]
MKLWNITAALLAASFVTSTAVAQQSQEELSKELRALKAQVDSQKQEIADLKAGVTQEASIETEINRLSERLAAATTVHSAANKISFTGEFRYRGYLDLGDDEFGDERDGWGNSSRVRIGFLYEFAKNVSAYAELQSNFAYGQNASTSVLYGAPSSGFSGGTSVEGTPSSSETDLGLYQAWLKVTNLFGRPEFSMKAGRQEVVFGNQFQFGNADWYNGISFDGVRYDWMSENFDLTAFLLRTSTEDINDFNQFPGFGSHDHDEIYGLYFVLKSIKNIKVDAYWFYANLHDGTSVNGLSAPLSPGAGAGSPTDYFHTIGARFGGDVDVAAGLDWSLEAAYQFGSTDDPPDIGALAVEGEIGVTFSKDNRFRAWIRGLYAEGPDGEDLGYQTLYPNRHSNTANFRARYGWADFFPMTNVFALTGGIHFDPSTDWTIGANLTWGQSEEDILPGIDDSYGWEIDVWAEYRYSESLTFNVGAAAVFADDSGVFASGGVYDDDVNFLVWLQARLFF